MIREGYKDFIDFLNEINDKDPDWLRKIIEHRPNCNRDIAYHPSIQVGVDKNLPEDKRWTAGFLGLVNGFFGTFDDGPYQGCGPVAAVVDELTGEIKGFKEFGT